MNCLWCQSTFDPRATGGKPQRYCSTPCRRAFDAASRKWVSAAIENSTFTVAELRTGSVATRALDTAQIITFPVPKSPEIREYAQRVHYGEGFLMAKKDKSEGKSLA